MHSRPQNSVSNFFLRIFWSDGVADVDLQLSPPSLFFLLKGWSLFSIHMYMCFEFLCSVIYASWSSRSRNCWFTDGLCVKFNISCDYTVHISKFDLSCTQQWRQRKHTLTIVLGYAEAQTLSRVTPNRTGSHWGCKNWHFSFSQLWSSGQLHAFCKTVCPQAVPFVFKELPSCCKCF